MLDNNPAWNDAIAHPVYHLDLKRKGWCKRRAGCRGGKVQQRPQSPLANLTGDETEMTAKNVEECIFKSRSTGCASSGTTSVLFSPWFAYNLLFLFDIVLPYSKDCYIPPPLDGVMYTLCGHELNE